MSNGMIIKYAVYSCILLLLLLPGCQKKVYLMPTPAVMQTGEHDPFAVNPELEETNSVVIAYATNRKGVGSDGGREQMTLCDAGDVFTIPANIEKSFLRVQFLVCCFQQDFVTKSEDFGNKSSHFSHK
jgi:hypothetical protein